MERTHNVEKKIVTTVLTSGLVRFVTATSAQDLNVVGVPGMEGFHLD